MSTENRTEGRAEPERDEGHADHRDLAGAAGFRGRSAARFDHVDRDSLLGVATGKARASRPSDLHAEAETEEGTEPREDRRGAVRT